VEIFREDLKVSKYISPALSLLGASLDFAPTLATKTTEPKSKTK